MPMAGSNADYSKSFFAFTIGPDEASSSEFWTRSFPGVPFSILSVRSSEERGRGIQKQGLFPVHEHRALNIEQMGTRKVNFFIEVTDGELFAIILILLTGFEDVMVL
jgi:hypothetical protein